MVLKISISRAPVSSIFPQLFPPSLTYTFFSHLSTIPEYYSFCCVFATVSCNSEFLPFNSLPSIMILITKKPCLTFPSHFLLIKSTCTRTGCTNCFQASPWSFGLHLDFCSLFTISTLIQFWISNFNKLIN